LAGEKIGKKDVFEMGESKAAKMIVYRSDEILMVTFGGIGQM
jgi:hypothetical protein